MISSSMRYLLAAALLLLTLMVQVHLPRDQGSIIFSVNRASPTSARFKGMILFKTYQQALDVARSRKLLPWFPAGEIGSPGTPGDSRSGIGIMHPEPAPHVGP